MGNISIQDITKARIEIERLVLLEAMDNIDSNIISQLEHNIRRAEERNKNNVMATDINLEFHNLLVKCCGNLVYEIIVKSILVLHGDILSRLPSNPERSKMAVSYHKKILDAIKKKDGEKAFLVLEEHLCELRESILYDMSL
jgi:DNA-binding GntR family transcriptional regulator